MLRAESGTYSNDLGYTLGREYGKTPNGNNMRGRWVLRDNNSKMLDFDRYINDISERHEIKLED